MTRYEDLLRSDPGRGRVLASAMAAASAASRDGVIAVNDRDIAIRDVAAGVAAPALVAYVLWVLLRAERLGLRRLCFLPRDAQVFYEIAQRLVPRLGLQTELRYVYGSRRTWNLAAAEASQLDQQDWLFNSFMRSNAVDVCARLGIRLDDFEPVLRQAGASLDPTIRADQPEQSAALRRFVSLPAVADAVSPRIHRMRELVGDYAVQEGIASASTGLVDAGWTGRNIGALSRVTAGLPQPKVFLWAHEPRATGWTDPTRVAAYMYNTATGDGVDLRVPDTPYIIETFCMSDHGITADYKRMPDGRIKAITETPDNPAVQAWGFDIFRSTIYRFCEALELPDTPHDLNADLRPFVSRVLHTFWITPTVPEAVAWGSYPYDSDPLARATRPLARPFDRAHLRAACHGAPLAREDRAWLQGSLALSGPDGASTAAVLSSRYEIIGAPAAD